MKGTSNQQSLMLDLSPLTWTPVTVLSRLAISEKLTKISTVEPLSNPDTNGAEESVVVSEVSSFQRLKCMQEWYLGWEKCPV